MTDYRNPFKLSAAENIQADDLFLRLFDPTAIDVLPTDAWKRLQILRSAPGGGKTSLLRLFTPSVLSTLHVWRANADCRDLYQRLRERGVFDAAGPTLLGVLLDCRTNFAYLEALPVSSAQQDRLFFALLNARVLLAALRAISALRRLTPAEFGRLEFDEGPDAQGTVQLSLPSDGRKLYDWAVDVERRVADAMDSFAPPETTPIGMDGLVTPWILEPDAVLLNGHAIAASTLVMFDNVQELTARQRRLLLHAVINGRQRTGVWVAERFEALAAEELLDPGAKLGRDYDAVIQLEGRWRAGRGEPFRRLALGAADRRVQSSTATELGSFSSCLEDGPDQRWDDQLSEASEMIAQRIRAQSEGEERYREWIASRELLEATPYERAVQWRKLAILVERQRRKRQQRWLEEPLSVEELEEESEDSRLSRAAELFLAHDVPLPYYFGPKALAALGSCNLEQFLWLAGEEFEQILSALAMKRAHALSPARQDQIVRKCAQLRWDDIPQRVTEGRRVATLLDAIGRYARGATYRPNAPYAPGVTGVAIRMSDRNVLRRALDGERGASYRPLALALSDAIAHGLLEPHQDVKAKGNTWLVFYLNRLLCVQFDLPLQYGGFREKRLEEMQDFLDGQVPAELFKDEDAE